MKRIREELLKGTYRPKPVRRVEIHKLGGGKQILGMPTVMDLLIQQAILQVLTPIFDPHFSEASYGFRPDHGSLMIRVASRPSRCVGNAIKLAGE